MKTKHWFAIAAAFVVPGIFWLGGFDFSERGEPAVTCALWTLFAIGVCLTKPEE